MPLKRAGGGNLKGLCPFHDEKSPSFNVTPARGFRYCFGCGLGGDAINFVMKIDHLTFAEAVERLADRAGIQLRYTTAAGPGAPDRAQGQRPGWSRRTRRPPSSTPSSWARRRPRRPGSSSPSAASTGAGAGLTAAASRPAAGTR